MHSYPRSPFSFLFYPFILAVLFAGIYGIYKRNPALMKHLSLLEIKQKEHSIKALHFQMNESLEIMPAQNTYNSSIDPQRSFSTPKTIITQLRFGRRSSTWGKPHSSFKTNSWNLNKDYFVSLNSKSLEVYNLNAEIVWQYQIKDEDRFCEGRPILTKTEIIVCTKSGTSFTFNQTDGKLVWYREGRNELKKNPTLANNDLIYLLQIKGNYYAEVVNLQNGQTKRRLKVSTSELSGPLAFNKVGIHIAAQTTSGSLSVYSFKTGNLIWSIENPTGFRGAPAYIGNEIYSVSEDGTVIGRHARTGKELWKYLINQTVETGIALIPEIKMGFVTDTEGYMHAIDLSEGKRKWRIALKNKAENRFKLAAKVDEAQVKKLLIPPDSKNWVIWTSCGASHICGYDPRNGIPLARFNLEGPMVDTPLWHPEGHSFWIPYQVGSSGQIRLFGKLPEPEQPEVEPSTEDPKTTAGLESGVDITPADQ